MFDLMRDAPLGQILNFVSKGKIFPYPEERPDYVVPEHFLPRTDEPHNYSREERTFDNDHAEQHRRDGKGGIHAGALKAAGKKPVKRLHKTDHELNDERESHGEASPRRSDSSSQTVVGDDDNSGRDEEEGVTREEKGEKGEKSNKKKVHNEDHWAYKLTADPQKAISDGRHEHYQYLVTWNGDDDPDNPLYVSFCLPCSNCQLTFRTLQKLYDKEENFPRCSNRSTYRLGLHGFCYLHSWRAISHATIRCLANRFDSWYINYFLNCISDFR